MIRLLDTEVFAVQRNEIDRTYVRRYFFRQGHMDDILVVYDREAYYGYITYDSYLKSSGSEDQESYIFREKYILTPDSDNIWSDIKEVIAGKEVKNTLIPIFNDHGEMLYFAYDDKWTNQMRESIVNSMLEELESMEEIILQNFFSEVYPKISGVQIYNLNEWGYRFYKIMVRCGYHMEVSGEKWGILYPKIVNNEAEQMGFVPETAFLNIYAEGTGFVCPWNLSERKVKNTVGIYWDELLCAISSNFYNWAEEKFLRKCRGIHFIKVTIPQKKDIIFKKEGEYHCRQCMPGVLTTDSLEEIKYCQEVYGKKITFEEWDRLCEDKKAESKYIAGKKVEIKYFGNKGKRKLYVVGPCIVAGMTVPDDKENFLYCLHEELEKRGEEYSVIGIVVSQSIQMNLYREVLENLTIQENDIVVSIYQDFGTYTYAEGCKLDLTEAYNKREEYWFYDIPAHTNYAGNKAVAKAVADNILSYVKEATSEILGGGYLQIGKRALNAEERKAVEQYIGQVQNKSVQEAGKNIGAIVMNCNPMTKGHLYLIETARRSVDFLYVFVVEEDRSDILFADRYAMVQAQTKEMPNVLVVPSGKFILSYETMPLYFEKAVKQEAVLDATADLQIFCQYIAPCLGITERFVGEEPTDRVTRQYNEEMKRMLPYYGMKLTEIARIKQGEEYISASSVRKLAAAGEWKAVRERMPQEAYRIYRDNWGTK